MPVPLEMTMSQQKLSALECPDVLSQPKDRDPDAVPCVLLQPHALPPGVHHPPEASQAPPSAPPGPASEVEDESADPVGDGHSDAELARRMGDGKPSNEPVDRHDVPAPDAEKGR
jgi:hypothetical protein